MDRKRKSRYVLAVYLLLATVAVILALVAVNYYHESQPLQALLINLSTELAGVVLIFLVVNRLFMLDRDRELTEQMARLRDDIRMMFSPFASRDDVNEEFGLGDLLLRAKTVDLVGYNLANLLGGFREQLAQAIQRETDVRVLLVNASSSAGELICDAKDDQERFLIAAKRGRRYLSEIWDLSREKDDVRGTLTVKLTSWVPSCHMIMVDGKQQAGIAKVGINPLSFRVGLPKRLSLILRKERHPQEFDYFESQFGLLWDDPGSILWDYTQKSQAA